MAKRKPSRWTLEKQNDLRKAFGNMGLFYMRPLKAKPGMLGIFTVKGDWHVGQIPMHPSLLRRTLELLMEQSRARGVRGGVRDVGSLPKPGLRHRRKSLCTPTVCAPTHADAPPTILPLPTPPAYSGASAATVAPATSQAEEPSDLMHDPIVNSTYVDFLSRPIG